MKLTKIAVSVVAVVAAVATGGSWYTGKQVEERYQQLITQANTQLKTAGVQYGIKAEIKDVELTRHFFSSDAKYRLEVDLGNGETLDFVGNDKIQHGPLPLNRLAKLNLSPVLMSMENNIQTPEQFKKMFGEKLGTGVANISYSGNTEGEFELSAAKFSDDNGTFEMTPIKLEYSYDQGAKNISGATQLESLKLKSADADFHIQGLSYDFHGVNSEEYANLGLGKGNATVKAIEFTTQDGLSQIKDIVLKGENVLKGDRVVSSGTLDAASFNLEGVELGKWKLDLAYDFDAKLYDQVVPAFSDPNALDNEQTGEMVLALLSKSPKFHINNFSFEKDSGKFDLALLLNLVQFDPQNVGDLNAVIKALSQSKFTSNVSREYAEDIVRQVSMKQGLSEEDAKAAAKQQTEAVFLNAESNGLKVENNMLKLELNVDNGKVIFNGRELSEDELQMALFMIMMGAGSLSQ